MVYTGKPSKGCHNCRRRKKKCDLLPDGCSQCSYSRRLCPGYPDQSEYVFRDQTQNVTRRLQQNTLGTSKSSSASYGVSRSQADISGRAVSSHPKKSPTTLVDMYRLLPSSDEKATAFFLSNFVLTAAGPTEGHLEHIPQTNYETEIHLFASIKAVGFAGLSGSFHDRTLLITARNHYVTAVRRTNIALRSPQRVKQDSTLLSVLILGLFERVAGDDNDSLINYEHHVKGAAAMLKVRGHNQLLAPKGRKLFIQVTAMILSLCMLQDIHIPTPILELREHTLIRAGVATDQSMQVLDTSITVVEFSANVKDGTITDPSYIVTRALELDRDFGNVFFQAPASWSYETVYDTDADPRAVHQCIYHKYDSPWTARMHSAHRLARLSLHTIIRDTLLKMTLPSLQSSVGLRYSAQLHESRDVMRMMQGDILASVPEYMGYQLSQPLLFDSHPATSGQRGVGDGSFGKQSIPYGPPPEQSSLKTKMVIRGQYIIFPLYKAGMVDVDETTREGRTWSLQMLQYIGQVVGIRQALVFAAMIKKSFQ